MASASCTSSNMNDGPCRRTRDPSLMSPTKFQHIPKEVGTKKLVLGQWVTVKAGDPDALPMKMARPSRTSGG